MLATRFNTDFYSYIGNVESSIVKNYILILLSVLLRQKRCHSWRVSISCTSNCVRCEVIFKENWGNRYWQVCTENVSTNRQFIFVTSKQFIMVENLQFWRMILVSRYLVMVICQTKMVLIKNLFLIKTCFRISLKLGYTRYRKKYCCYQKMKVF